MVSDRFDGEMEAQMGPRSQSTQIPLSESELVPPDTPPLDDSQAVDEPQVAVDELPGSR